jgi:hypothetical protein
MLSRVPAEALCVTSGELRRDGPGVLRVDVAGMRGELAPPDRAQAAAQDACDVVYVMWHVEPTPGVFVSVKSDPGQSTHAECGARGYVSVRPLRAAPAPVIVSGASHALRATLSGDELEIAADGAVVWTGRLPRDALASVSRSACARQRE